MQVAGERGELQRRAARLDEGGVHRHVPVEQVDEDVVVAEQRGKVQRRHGGRPDSEERRHEPAIAQVVGNRAA